VVEEGGEGGEEGIDDGGDVGRASPYELTVKHKEE
jgi:hypothetical protein